MENVQTFDDPGPYVAVRDLTRVYASPAGRHTALDAVSLELAAGEFVAVVGASGSGKSTLLNLLAGIDRPTSGEIVVGGRAVHALTEEELSVWRGRNVGIVFQFFQLLPTLTALENVLLPMDFVGVWPARDRAERGLALLDRVGVADQADKLPETLSGGQRQRVAVARALANDPPLVVADEPTGNLDSATSAEVVGLFAELAEAGRTVAMVTHEPDVGGFATRRVEISDGVIVGGGARDAHGPDAGAVRA